MNKSGTSWAKSKEVVTGGAHVGLVACSSASELAHRSLAGSSSLNFLKD